ncbi:hypothetical protein J6590_001678 [Homalodisca vitripennis]|nr:hypothetical protein J6590_001678 [Homalodisca vitripennis]
MRGVPGPVCGLGLTFFIVSWCKDPDDGDGVNVRRHDSSAGTPDASALHCLDRFTRGPDPTQSIFSSLEALTDRFSEFSERSSTAVRGPEFRF